MRAIKKFIATVLAVAILCGLAPYLLNPEFESWVNHKLDIQPFAASTTSSPVAPPEGQAVVKSLIDSGTGLAVTTLETVTDEQVISVAKDSRDRIKTGFPVAGTLLDWSFLVIVVLIILLVVNFFGGGKLAKSLLLNPLKAIATLKTALVVAGLGLVTAPAVEVYLRSSETSSLAAFSAVKVVTPAALVALAVLIFGQSAKEKFSRIIPWVATAVAMLLYFGGWSAISSMYKPAAENVSWAATSMAGTTLPAVLTSIVGVLVLMATFMTGRPGYNNQDYADECVGDV